MSLQGSRHALQHRKEQRRSTSARSRDLCCTDEFVVAENAWRRCIVLKTGGPSECLVACFAEAREYSGITPLLRNRRGSCAAHPVSQPFNNCLTRPWLFLRGRMSSSRVTRYSASSVVFCTSLARGTVAAGVVLRRYESQLEPITFGILLLHYMRVLKLPESTCTFSDDHPVGSPLSSKTGRHGGGCRKYCSFVEPHAQPATASYGLSSYTT